MAPADRLAKFVSIAHSNASKQLEGDAHLVKRLKRLNDAFALLTENLDEPQSLVAATFALDVYSRFLGACLLTLAGQLREAYPLLRSGLEAGMYSLVLEDDPALLEAWFKRDDEPKARKKLRDALTKTRMLDAVATRDRALRVVIERQLEDTITFGAHPNSMAVAGSLAISSDDTKTTYVRPILGGTPIEIAGTHTDLIRIGISMLELLIAQFQDRSKILGVTDTVKRLKRPPKAR